MTVMLIRFGVYVGCDYYPAMDDEGYHINLILQASHISTPANNPPGRLLPRTCSKSTDAVSETEVDSPKSVCRNRLQTAVSCFGSKGCGAVTGAIMLIGLKYGKVEVEDNAAKDKHMNSSKSSRKDLKLLIAR